MTKNIFRKNYWLIRESPSFLYHGRSTNKKGGVSVFEQLILQKEKLQISYCVIIALHSREANFISKSVASKTSTCGGAWSVSKQAGFLPFKRLQSIAHLGSRTLLLCKVNAHKQRKRKYESKGSLA